MSFKILILLNISSIKRKNVRHTCLKHGFHRIGSSNYLRFWFGSGSGLCFWCSTGFWTKTSSMVKVLRTLSHRTRSSGGSKLKSLASVTLWILDFIWNVSFPDQISLLQVRRGEISRLPADAACTSCLGLQGRSRRSPSIFIYLSPQQLVGVRAPSNRALHVLWLSRNWVTHAVIFLHVFLGFLGCKSWRIWS